MVLDTNEIICQPPDCTFCVLSQKIPVTEKLTFFLHKFTRFPKILKFIDEKPCKKKVHKTFRIKNLGKSLIIKINSECDHLPASHRCYSIPTYRIALIK